MEATIRRETEPLVNDLGVTTRRDKPTGGAAETGNGSKLRAQLESAVAKAKQVCDRLQNQTAAAAKATDKSIREHPYQAIGIALGLGAVIGALIMWKRRD
jgi:ElaB/YqjD/DUF883 family membrane-anchored ribosome-binding protein